MAKDLSFQVVNVRPGGAYSVMGCDLAVGFLASDQKFVGLMTVRSIWLGKTKEGGYMIKWPSKLRVRNGETMKDDKGFDKYDNLVDLYGEMGGGGDPTRYAITEGAWKFKERLIQLMLEAAGTAAKVEAPTPAPAAAGASARPPALPSRAPSRAAPGRAPAPAPAAAAVDDDDDDDLPF